MDSVIGNLLQQFLHAGSGPVPAAAQDQFHQVAESTPPDLLSHGLADAFNSPQTPAFGEMVGHMFGQANPDQKTGIVNRLLASAGPAAMALLSQAGLTGLGPAGAGSPNLSTEQVAQLSSEQVAQIATQAKSANPGIVESMSSFYAQHPMLVKSLGAAALAIILGKIGNRSA